MRDHASPIALRRRDARGGQVVVLLLVVLAIVGAGAWWLFSEREKSERDARAFAKETATRLAFHHDLKFLNHHLGREAQVKYPPSFRERFFNRLSGLGTPSGSPEVSGRVFFTSQFFQPVGEFTCKIEYPNAPATISLAVSRPSGRWQIDYLNLIWTPPGSPAAQPQEMQPQEMQPQPTP